MFNNNNIVNPEITDSGWRLIYNILSADKITTEQIESLLSYKSSSSIINQALTNFKNGTKFTDLPQNFIIVF